MNAVTPEPLVDPIELEREVLARDRQIGNNFAKDPQVMAIRGARGYLADKLVRVARPHRLLDPKAGPLIAVRLNILTRKTLGGLETDLESRCCAVTAHRFRASTPPVRSLGSEAEGCTATGPWRGRSSAAACSPAERRAGRPPPRWPEPGKSRRGWKISRSSQGRRTV
jgi:uncharacterized protein